MRKRAFKEDLMAAGSRQRRKRERTLDKLSEGGERLVRGVPGARGWVGRWVRPLTRGMLSRDGF